MAPPEEQIPESIMLDLKASPSSPQSGLPRPARSRIPWSTALFFVSSIFIFGIFELSRWNGGSFLSSLLPLTDSENEHLSSQKYDGRVVRHYNLTVGARWMNPDGARWRVMIVCNGQTPCPTLLAEEGDLVQLTLHNDLYAQSSIHWSGRTYKNGPWNDGTPGISQFPMLPRGNWSSVHDTTGSWGLNWYAEHATAGSADGLYGLIWVAPHPDRPRPYHFLTKDPVQLKLMHEAEREIQHFVIKNHQGRDTTWKLLRMRAEGSEFYCYDSFLVNGKGRVHCRQPGYDTLNGHRLDETGCIQPEGLPEEKCTPSTADYQVIETNGQEYLMLNLLNSGFEHTVRVSIDGHKMIVVANDGGFVEPEEVDTVHIMSAARTTVLIKLDAEARDYAVRISSTSHLQNLHGYAILRYPAKRAPMLGAPMVLPKAPSPESICVLPDGSVPQHCAWVDPNVVPPYPSFPPPLASRLLLDGPSTWKWWSGPSRRSPHARGKDRSVADFTFKVAVGVQASQTEPHAPEYFLNKKPWQLFHSSMTPLLFAFSSSSSKSPPGAEPAAAATTAEARAGGSQPEQFDDPILAGPLPIGSVVDIIIDNTLNETLALYKHGAPTWWLGVGEQGPFPYENVFEAVHSRPSLDSQRSDQDDTALQQPTRLNLDNPARHTTHEVPPLGWSVVRFQVTSKEVTMMHAVKLRHFVLGMAMPILEGLTPEDLVRVPAYAADRPHVEFEPKNDGVFG